MFPTEYDNEIDALEEEKYNLDEFPAFKEKRLKELKILRKKRQEEISSNYLKCISEKAKKPAQLDESLAPNQPYEKSSQKSF